MGIYEGDHASEEQLHSASISLVDAEDVGLQDQEEIPPPTTSKNWDSISRAPSTASIKKLYVVGRRGTAFVGRQIQQRMSAFQGVGVNTTAPQPSSAPPKMGIRRAQTVDFARISVHSLHNHPPTTGPPSLVSQQVRGQLSHDVWWIALMLFLIAVIETKHSLADPLTFNVWTFLFEIVAGYTTGMYIFELYLYVVCILLIRS